MLRTASSRARVRLLAALLLGPALAPRICPPARAAETPPPAHRFEIGTADFLLDGQPFQIRCGEMHFARVPREYWSHRLRLVKAMGLNTVCAYLFWNFHEWRQGRFDWQGQRDAAEFCRLAQAEGLWVILRPGPYACSEWEMGGLPWWLLKHPGDRFLRSRDPAFLTPARRWLAEVGRVLGPLQVTHGGPIILVQVENEYGYYGGDPDYMRAMRQAVLDAGFDVPLFACNPSDAVVRSHLPGLFSVANFGSDPAAGFAALAEVQKGPLMCGEFYTGWFDIWGAPHRRGDTPPMLRDLAFMLSRRASFSFYMVHGGTTFGLWAGADHPFRPDTSSYDYDAPISEAGWIGEKYAQVRAAIRPGLRPGETLPEPPAPMPVIEIPPFELTASAAVLANLPGRSIAVREPQPIEQYDISRGIIDYRTTLPAGPAGVLEAASVRDLAWVFLDGRPAGVMDARFRRFRASLPARSQPATLDLLVYTIARVNFGVEIHDRKGLRGPVNFRPASGAPRVLEGWDIRAIDFDADGALPPLAWRPGPATGPAFWCGTFRVDTPGDTFLDVSTWGMGVVWVNGRCLGRYWNIGPTQTMYLPGPWLKPGSNEIVVLDLAGPERSSIAGVRTPILDRPRPEKDVVPHNDRGTLLLGGVAPTAAGTFAPGLATQEIRFAAPVSGGQFCLESVDAYDGREYAAVAEIQLLDADGRVMNESAWTIAYADSEEVAREDGSADNAINGQPSNHWHTRWSGPPPYPGHPHRLIIDLGATVRISGFRYTPRQGGADATGRIKSYRVYVGDRLVAPAG